MRRQARLEKLLSDIPVVGGLAKSGLDATKAAIREMWEPTAFFEALGVRYAGPFDGHDIAVLEEALRNATAMRDSTGLLPFAERFPGRMFDVGIAEQHAVTAAAGMAAGGLRPVVAVYS